MRGGCARSTSRDARSRFGSRRASPTLSTCRGRRPGGSLHRTGRCRSRAVVNGRGDRRGRRSGTTRAGSASSSRTSTKPRRTTTTPVRTDCRWSSTPSSNSSPRPRAWSTAPRGVDSTERARSAVTHPSIDDPPAYQAPPRSDATSSTRSTRGCTAATDRRSRCDGSSTLPDVGRVRGSLPGT